MIQKLKRNWLVVLKLTWGFSQILTQAPESLKNSSVLIGSLWPKYIIFELQKYIEVIFHDTEEWCKIWRKNDIWFEKWHEKFDKFSPEHLKVSKLGLWWDPSVQSRRGMTLKFSQDMSQELYVTFQELCVMTMKNNANVEEELTCHFKTDMGNLTNFDSSTRKSEGKLTCAFKNDMRNLTNMHRLK